MLLELSIRNYALIDEVNLQLGEGLTIVTGETGAGKSVIIGALGLILGERANTEVLRNDEEKCIIEGKFDISQYGLESFFEEHDLDHDPQTTIRREVNPKGRSRAFINDTPVKLEQLKAFGIRLVDIHSQDQTLLLNDPSFQLEVVDAFTGHQDLLQTYGEQLKNYRETCRTLEEKREQEAQARVDLDYYQFQFNELEEAQLQEGEQESLEKELDILNNAEAIKTELDRATGLLQGSEENLLGHLRTVNEALRKVSEHNDEVSRLQERLDSASIELADIASDVERIGEETRFDPERYQQVQERLDLIYRLQHKHGVNTLEELMRVREEVSEKIRSIGSLDEEIQALEEKENAQQEKLEELAHKISKGREKVIPEIAKHINDLLPPLGMENAAVEIHQEVTDTYGEKGKDKVLFFFSPGKGAEPKLLNKVMSGGERSRVMLAIKQAISERSPLPTMVLDEIDTGVSGGVAEKLGELMKEISGKMQVISITHLPQVAGKGDRHFRAIKETRKGKTITGLQPLDEKERLEELARMLSGEELTDAAFENARELLSGS